VQTEQGMNNVYIHAGTNPFDTITQAGKYVVFYVARLDSSKVQLPTTAANSIIFHV
jgi:hypothetical protein